MGTTTDTLSIRASSRAEPGVEALQRADSGPVVPLFRRRRAAPPGRRRSAGSERSEDRGGDRLRIIGQEYLPAVDRLDPLDADPAGHDGQAGGHRLQQLGRVPAPVARGPRTP
jgi:hypothetical protein